MANNRLRKVILTADDYGAIDFIDNGIIEAVRAGKISSVACFVVFNDSAARLLKLKDLYLEMEAAGKPFGIGLHFSISAGYPLLQVKSMMTQKMADGSFQFKGPDYYPYDSFKKEDRICFKAELREQINRLTQILGPEIPIDSVSNHDGFAYLAADLHQDYIDVISDFKIPVRSAYSWFRYKGFHKYSKIPPIALEGFSNGAWRSMLLLKQKSLRKKRQMAVDAGLKTPFALCETIYGQPDIINLMGILHEYDDQVMAAELMFHLGLGPLPKSTPPGINPEYLPMRSEEYDSLMHLVLEDYCGNQGNKIRICTFSGLSADDWMDPEEVYE